MGAQLKVIERGFARRQKHESYGILKALSKETQDAVDKLVKLMASQDEKIAFQAAKAIIELQREIANDINTDDLQRLMANAKFGGPREGSTEDDDTPEVDFDTVQEIN